MKRYGIMLVIAIILFVLSLMPLFNIKTITENTSSSNLTPFMVDLLLDQNWLWKSEDQLADELKMKSDVGDIVVKKTGLLKVEVSVTPREAFLAVHSGMYYVIIDTYGIVIEVSESPEAPFVVEGFHVVSSKIGHQIVAENMDLIERAAQLAYLFDEYVGNNPTISLIDGELVIGMTDDITMNFGTADEIVEQFSKAIELYKSMLAKGSDKGIINVKNINQIILEPNKK